MNRYEDFLPILSPLQSEKLNHYFSLLTKIAANSGMIAKADNETLWLRHIIDSLLVHEVFSFAEYNYVADIGSGAGLPSVPLAILYPEIEFHLLDSNQKRNIFIEQVKQDVSLPNIKPCKCRIEDYSKNNGRKFHLVLMRAFQKPLISLELALHVLSIDNGTKESKLLYWRSNRFDNRDMVKEKN